MHAFARCKAQLGAFAACLLAAAPAWATITDIRGSVKAFVQEFRNGSAGEIEDAFETLPGSRQQFPLQVLSKLLSAEPEEAGAAVAVQLADPRVLEQQNPAEFAMNVALSSVSPGTRFEARGLAEEIREIVFEFGELGAQPLGTAVRIRGRVFLDGALAIFSARSRPDLTGAGVRMLVTVHREVEGQTPDPVFRGELALDGGADGGVSVGALGAFPTQSLVLTDLSPVTPELPTFHVLIIPPLTIEYDYDAVVGEPFVLRATVDLQARNIGDKVGVAGILGTPVDALTQIIAATEGEALATATATAIQTERTSPTGVKAFPADEPPAAPLGLCGLFGFETALGLAGLTLMRYRMR